MAQEIAIPKLGLTMLEATLVSWSVAAGDRVVDEQIICVIETDKVSFEMPSPGSGWLHPLVEPGQRLEVGELIGYLAADENELNTLQSRHPAAQNKPVEQQPVGEPLAVDKPSVAAEQKMADVRRVVATPAARKHAEAHAVDLVRLSGSGPRGRIILTDVEQAVEAGLSAPIDTAFGWPAAAADTQLLTVADQIPIRGIRKIILKSMKLSLSSQAQLTLHTDASAQDMRRLRRLFKARPTAGQPPFSYNAVFVKAVAQSLRLYPLLNATVDGREIKIWEQIHIGIAMDFGHGLIVPKVRNADTKSMDAICAEIHDLAARAQKKQLLPDELHGGTFTISNMGSWEVDHFTPISNFPESAILGVGRIVEKPWVRNGVVVAEPRIGLSLTFDHRIIDGALAAEFFRAIRERIEETRLMI